MSLFIPCGSRNGLHGLTAPLLARGRAIDTHSVNIGTYGLNNPYLRSPFSHHFRVSVLGCMAMMDNTDQNESYYYLK